MQLKKEHKVLILIVALTLGFRLAFAFTSPYLSDSDSYFNLRDIEGIKDTWKPLFNDPLSYGGRNALYSPVFDYLFAILSFVTPFAVKVLPNVFATLLVLTMYLLTRELTKNSEAALFSAFLAGFIPIFVFKTLNSITVYALSIPLTVLFLYTLLKIGEGDYMLYLLLATIFILARLHASSFFVIFATLIYLLLCKIEKVSLPGEEFEVILFATFVLFWFQFIIYKKALLAHGALIIWQNIPLDILSRYFSDFNLIYAIYSIGALPFLAGIYVIYRYLFRKKERSAYLLMAFAFSIFLLLLFRLIELEVGLMFLGTIMVVLSGIFYDAFFGYLKHSKVHKYKHFFVLGILLIFIVSSVVPSIVLAYKVMHEVPTADEVAALEFLRKDAKHNEAVLATPEEGHLVTYFARKKNVMDTHYLLIPGINERYQDIKTIYTTPLETVAIPLLDKYGVKYIYFSDKARQEYGIEKIQYVDDVNCFQKMYSSSSVEVYKSLCSLEQQ
ncbi:hypothetical protein HZB01_03395 [Candidatus Woesearchaeota archaeon]|nr:hypothetical protein [Candidatus Woesearchaeota archaeon]